ncbi:MAG: hypothetical protein HFJ27_01460 [Clostridia bacterium]|nr:hypothetical protein [Clostridia bacterium]
MKKLLVYIPSIIFNIVELIMIYLIGLTIGILPQQIIILFLLFVLTRTLLKGQLHYKNWRKCFVWSVIVFSSFFLMAKSEMMIASIMTVFSGYILTQKSNIEIEKLENE